MPVMLLLMTKQFTLNQILWDVVGNPQQAVLFFLLIYNELLLRIKLFSSTCLPELLKVMSL